MAEAIEARQGQPFRIGSSDRLHVALTFDDGPHPRYTPRILDILREEKIAATFNMVGSMVQKYPETDRRVARAGHEIGCHSFSHPDLRRLSRTAVEDQIISASELIERVTGQRPLLFRPPGGFIASPVREVCKEAGLAILLWSVDPRDWTRDATVQSIRSITLEQVRPGAIICLHDTKSGTVRALPGLIADLRAHGYEFVPASRILRESEAFRRAHPGRAAEASGEVARPVEPRAVSLAESAVPRLPQQPARPDRTARPVAEPPVPVADTEVSGEEETGESVVNLHAIPLEESAPVF